MLGLSDWCRGIFCEGLCGGKGGVVINGGSPLRMGALCGGHTLGDNRA